MSYDYEPSFFDIYCETFASDCMESFKKEERDTIEVNWSEVWVNDLGETEDIDCCISVDTLKKASNLVGALLLGLKTHKSFGSLNYKGEYLGEDSRHTRTKVKYLNLY